MLYQLPTLLNRSQVGKYFSSSALPEGCEMDAADSFWPVGSRTQSKQDMMNSWAWSLTFDHHVSLSHFLVDLLRVEAQRGVPYVSIVT